MTQPLKDGRIVLIDWEGRRRPRREVIHELHALGVPVAEVARRLGVRYQIVYMVLRSESPSVRPALKWTTDDLPVNGLPLDAVLIGCVGQKANRPLPAKDLYTSELFRRRRLYAEASGSPWWVYSAEYGLVAPEEVIAPYDTRIVSLPLERRQQLAQSIADGLEEALGTLSGKRIEIHAGNEYVLAVSSIFRARGVTMIRPLQGLAIGEQLAWYGARLGLTGRTVSATEREKPLPVLSELGDGRGLGLRISSLFMEGRLDLSARSGAPPAGWEGMPEVVAVTKLRNVGATPQVVRLFLTFCAAMDRARDADRLAVAAVRLYQDQPWAYDPRVVLDRPVRDLADVLRRYGVSQRHLIDTYGWRVIAETLAEPAVAPEVHASVYEGRGDARALLDELARVSADGTPLFPLLGGPKVGPLWVRLLAYPGGAAISSLEVVPVAVDVQVRKVTEFLGVTDTLGLDLEAIRRQIQDTWARDVAEHGAAGPDGLANTAAALDPALWFYAKWGCTFCQRAGRQIPISPVCAECRFNGA